MDRFCLAMYLKLMIAQQQNLNKKFGHRGNKETKILQLLAYLIGIN